MFIHKTPPISHDTKFSMAEVTARRIEHCPLASWALNSFSEPIKSKIKLIQPLSWKLQIFFDSVPRKQSKCIKLFTESVRNDSKKEQPKHEYRSVESTN